MSNFRCFTRSWKVSLSSVVPLLAFSPLLSVGQGLQQEAGCFGLCSLQDLQGLRLGLSIWGCGCARVRVAGEGDMETEWSPGEREGK